MAQPGVQQILTTLSGQCCYRPIFINDKPKSEEGKASWTSVESGRLGRPTLHSKLYSERVSKLVRNAE